MRNCKIKKNNKTGYKGVHKHSQQESYIAQIRINNKTKHIGCFVTPKEAFLARIEYIKLNNIEGYELDIKTSEKLFV